MNFSGMELVLLSGILSGGSIDVAMMFDPEDYFKTQNIPVNVQQMVGVAENSPVRGGPNFSQLMALRWLELNAATINKSPVAPAVRKRVEAVAMGKKGGDRYGFAVEYARHTARALGSKLKFPQPPPAKASLPKILGWLPSDASFVAAAGGTSGSRGELPAAIKPLQKMAFQGMPQQFKQEMYNFFDRMGNVRLSGFVLGYAEGPNNTPGRLYVRLMGKVDPEGLIRAITNLPEAANNLKIVKDKTRNIIRIEIVNAPGDVPGIALVGDSDLLLAGVVAPAREQHNAAVLEQMLKVRSGKSSSVLKAGKLKKELEALSPQAIGFIAGGIPEEVRRSFMQGDAAFRVFPARGVVQAFKDKKGVRLEVTTEMDNARDATTFVADVNRLKQTALEQLDQAAKRPVPAPIPGIDMQQMFRSARELLESIDVTAKGKAIRGRIRIPRQLLSPSVFFYGTPVRPGAAPPPIPEGKKKAG